MSDQPTDGWEIELGKLFDEMAIPVEEAYPISAFISSLIETTRKEAVEEINCKLTI